jgi:hydrogenase maturation protein HypF
MGKSEAELKFQLKMIEKHLNCVDSTSSGRLFDGVAAILGICSSSTFEGEAAMKLQFAAEKYKGEGAFELTGFFAGEESELFQLDTGSLVKHLIAERIKGTSQTQLAWTFHASLAALIAAGARKCREKCGIEICALSGGVFQNTLLMELVVKQLEKDGFNILHHRLVPPNDGGIALGQAAVAMYQLNKKD